MKKATMVLGLLAASTSAAWAQSSVTLYGIVDAGARLQTNAGLTAATKSSNISSLADGGMSQSRFGINVTEDLGGGLKALVNLEDRFSTDTGTTSGTQFWQQSWVGLQSSDFGRITLGRQYNVLFDVTTTTYVSYNYSPYANIYKPEVGMQMGSRNDNMIKYMFEAGGLRAEAQVSAGEGNAIVTGANGKSMGALLRYATGPFAVGASYLELDDPVTAAKAKAMNAGVSYTDGPWYISAAYAQNKFPSNFNAAGTVNATVAGSFGGALNATAANDSEREMYTAGIQYQLTPQLNLGANFWNVKQTGYTAAGNSKINLFNMVADYAFSKRTDAYLEFDNTSFSGGTLAFSNGATSRASYMAGLRHRF